jgi:hypothetical protein
MPEPRPSAAVPIEPFDPLTEEGAAELRRRIERATPRRVERGELDGHIGLSSRELYELGVTVAPVGLRGVPSAVGGRMLVLLGAVLGTALLALAASVLLEPLLGVVLGDDVRYAKDRGLASGLGLAVFVGLPGWGLLILSGFGVRRIRAGLDARRRSIVDRATPAADDAEARATVAVVREPGVLRVALLSLRGDAEDAARVELRTLAEERIPDDEPGRAEDAVARLSEVALRADAGRAVPWTGRRPSPRPGASASASASPADAGGRADRALVAAARAALPPVDPREPVGPHWDPEPLTDGGRAEIAARLVRARPLLWNAGMLDALTVDAGRRRPRAPRAWPGDRKRREPLPTRLPAGRRAALGAVAWFAFLVCLAAVGGMDGAENPQANRVLGAVTFSVAALIGGNLWWWRHHGPGRRLLRSVGDAARVPGRGLERGVPGPGGRVLVLHGRKDDGVDRIELVHARAVPGEERGRLQVRTLAWREVERDGVERPDEVAQHFWTVADDAGFVTGRGEREAGTVRRINAALGRVVERRRATLLVREPLVWAAAPLAVLSLLVAVVVVFPGDHDREGLALSICLACWPLAAAVVLWRAARRVHDPVDE